MKRALRYGLLVSFTLLRLEAGDIFSATGITEPVFDVTLSLAVPGIITVQRFQEGDFVSTNDVLLEVDQRLEELETKRKQFIMENRKNDWESTKIVYEETKSISKDELDKKELEYKVANADYEIAEEQLRRRRLLAPGAGIIAEWLLDVGEACQPYQPLARLVDIRRCYFISNIEARRSSRLKLNQVVRLEIEDDSAPIQIKGRIIFLSPVIDPASGLQEVKVLFDNADGKIRPGLAGTMFLD